MPREEFTVKGTRFSFPELPPREEMSPALFDKITASRAKVRSVAENAHHARYRGPKPIRPVPPGDGTFAPEYGAPGSVVRSLEGHEYEVQMLAPGAGKVWAYREGSWYLFTLKTAVAHRLTGMAHRWDLRLQRVVVEA